MFPAAFMVYPFVDDLLPHRGNRGTEGTVDIHESSKSRKLATSGIASRI